MGRSGRAVSVAGRAVSLLLAQLTRGLAGRFAPGLAGCLTTEFARGRAGALAGLVHTCILAVHLTGHFAEYVTGVRLIIVPVADDAIWRHRGGRITVTGALARVQFARELALRLASVFALRLTGGRTVVFAGVLAHILAGILTCDLTGILAGHVGVSFFLGCRLVTNVAPLTPVG